MAEHLGEHIKAVLFDFDDTLVGTFKAKRAQHKYIANRYYGKELTDAELREHWGKPFAEVLSIWYGTDDLVKAREYVETHRGDYPKELFPGTIPTFRH